MTITPQGEIYLCKTPLENDYKNQLTFSNATAQLSYFNSIIQHTFDNYTYVKKDNVVKVGENIDNIIDCNYLFYRNTGFTSKYYFCFITNMEYVNENCTAITFETDVFQTWQFQIVYKQSFIEREHVNDDTIGLHTIPENLESGEYVDQVVTSSEIIEWRGFLATQRVVLATSESPFTEPSGDKKYNGVYSALYYFTFPTYNDCQGFIDYLKQQYSSDVIYSAFLVPEKLVHNVSWVTPSGENFTYGYVPYTENATEIKTLSISNNKFLDVDYVPRNNKLLCYPYRFLLVTNNAGSSKDYHYELFKNNNTCNFSIMGAISPGCSIKLFPKDNYNSVANLDYTNYNYAESLDYAKLPTCGWINDSYTNWLTQNAVNLPLELIGSAGAIVGGAVAVGTGAGAGVGIGAIVGGISGITNTMAKVYEHSLAPSTAKGGANQGDLLYAMRDGFTPYKKSIKREYAESIDSYFDMFGYKINKVKTPNITGRQNWNYVKTINCNFEGDIPQTDLRIIKSMFDNGVTLWHNPATIYNYNASNNII